MADSAENISNLAKATEEATAPIRLAKAQTARRGETDLTATAQKDTIAGVAQPEGEPEGAMREEVGTREETDQRLENASLEIEDIAKLSQTASTKGEWQSIIERLTRLGADFNVIPDTTEGGITPQQKARFDDIIVKKSMLCRDVAGRLVEFGDQSLLDGLVKIADKEMDDFLKNQVKLSKTTEDDAKGSLTGARKYLKEWLNPNSKIPKYMLQGIYRAMLEGRNEDILYSFGPGWKEFGTAGIRNQAVQSSYVDTIQRLELREFATNQFASVLPGPNLINVVTLLQQEASIVRIMRDLQAKIAAGDPAVAKMDPEFVENLRRNRVTIAYDSRINGEYFAKILAAAFLRDGVDVDLFDNTSGVPHLAWAAKREGSAFGFLISASHSEANYNGFKAFLGHQMSQVDKDSKNMIVKARSSVGYNVMNLDLAMPDADLDDIIRSTGNVRWIGGDEQRAGKDYLDRGLVSFYPWYYEEVRKRSPLALLDEDTQRAVRAHQTENPVRAVYSAFFGVGATPAADFRDFLKRQGYEAVDIVKAQTEVMDGMFPGHKMPDPGIVQGWISNLIDYFVQYGGDDLSDLDKAVEAFNNKDVGIATDPDIDRAGIMINLPAGVRGNIKERLIAAIAGYIDRADAIPQDKKEAVKAAIVKKLKAGLQDKMLLTANDAWTFMMYWKLKMMEENGQLEKDRVYIIEKSHVTTSALERVAALYRDKGYKVYVVDTYVGFTEIGKKGRDLFKIARLSAEVSNITRPETLTNEQKGQLEDLLNELRKADVELRKNVPQQTAGVSIIDDAIKSLAAVVEGSADHRQVQGYFYALSRMHILAGVEESNGYGELGRWNPELGKFELNHISDKDGSLAAFEFMELIAYGSYKGQSAYDMYKDLMSDIGYVCTVNSALYHPGLTGVADKVYEIQALEKIAAYELQKRLDRGEQVYLFNGRYRVKRVEVFRDAKNDKNYLGFAEEGIRLYVETLSGGEGIVTFRPSGTGDSNRVYSWLLGKKPEAGADLEGYRKGIDDEMDMMVRDFYGEETRETGYASASTEEFTGLIKALKESGLKGQFETLGKLVSEGPLAFTPAEQRLYEADVGYARAAKQGYDDEALLLERRKASRQAWAEYLESPEAKASQVNIPFSVNGEVVAEIPRAAAMAWQTSLVDYLIGLAMDAGADKESIESADKEMLALAKARFDSYGLEGAMREEGAADWADLDWNKKNIDSMLQPTKDAIRLSEAVQQETKQIVVFKSLLPKAQTRKPEFEASHAMWKYDMGRALDQRELADGTQRYKLIFVDSPEDLEKKIANGDVDVNNAIAIAPKEEADALPGDMKVLAVDRDNDPEGKQFVNLPALVGFAVPLVNLDREQIEKDPTVVDPIAVLYEAITGNKPENMKGLLLSTIYSRQEGVPKRFDIKLPPAQKFDFNQIDELQKRALEVLTSA